MCLLIANICSHLINNRLRYSNSKVLMLPLKLLLSETLLIYPMRGFAFEEFYHFGDRLLSSKRDQTMSVFDPPVDVIQKYAFCLSICSNVIKDLLTDIVIKEWVAVLCRPDEMDPDFNMRHSQFRLKPETLLCTLVLPLKWEATEKRLKQASVR